MNPIYNLPNLLTLLRIRQTSGPDQPHATEAPQER